MAISLVVVLVVLYFWIVPLRPVVLSLVNEVQTHRQDEALARQESAKAQADLLAALGDLRDEIKAERIALRVAEVAAKQNERKGSRASAAELAPVPAAELAPVPAAELAPPPAAVEASPGEVIPAPRPSATDAPEGDRVTLEISRPPPGCEAEAAAAEAEGLGDGDPTKVLSREATAAAMRGLAYNPAPRGEPKRASESPPSHDTVRKAMRPPAPSLIRPTREVPLYLEDLLLDGDSDENDGDTLGPDDLTPANGSLGPSSRLRNGSRGSRLTQ
jgi:hypothetical protein